MPASEIDDIFAGKTKDISTLASSGSKAKGKGKATEKHSSTGTPASSESKKKKKKRKLEDREDGVTVEKSEAKEKDASNDDASSSKKKKKRKKEHIGEEEKTEVASAPPKKRIPETVLDPSLSLGKDSKKSLVSSESVSRKPEKSKTSKRGGDKDAEEMKRFRDSRGTGPRKRTEEGYLVYKEDELGIQDEGGDTPLCPFDCDCCF